MRLEGSRHEKVIIVLASYVIGFLTAYIAFGINSTYAQNTVGGCLADAIGVYAVVEFAQTGQLSQTAVIKLVKKVGAKYLVTFGAALAVWDFVNCMGWV